MTEKTKVKIDKVKKVEKKKGGVGELTDEEREAVTIVFHQFETGLREGTIFTKVAIFFQRKKKGLTKHFFFLNDRLFLSAFLLI